MSSLRAVVPASRATAKNPTHLLREHRHCEGTEPRDYEQDTFAIRWRSEALRVGLGVVDGKARDFAVFYYNTPRSQQNIKHAALCYGVERETAANYMKRLDKLGLIRQMASPTQAREVTPPRVYLRRVFWTDDFWNSYSWGPDGP